MNFSIAVMLLAAITIPLAFPAQATTSSSAGQSLPAALYSSARTPEVLRIQVLLDRSPHSPGVIDGIMGGNTRRAIIAFEREAGLAPDGRIDPELLAKLKEGKPGEIFKSYTIEAADVAGPFIDVPAGMEAMSKLETLGYGSAAEALAERFHMAQSFLEALNPGVDFSRPGAVIKVIASEQRALPGEVARIEVNKASASLYAFGADGNLIATFPATIGSADFPSPSGDMEVRTVAAAPVYYFDPEGREWGPERRLTIAAGPNNPVGSTWIDLTKEGYGIHGSPDPRLIGKTSSHGCVRMTNWDVQALSRSVGQGTKVVFVDA